MQFRRLTTVEDMEQCVHVQIAAWDLDPVEAMPHHFFMSVIKMGGLIVGVFDKSHLVGFMYTLPSLYFGRVTQELDMIGIHPAYQQKGLATALFNYYIKECRTHSKVYDYAPIISQTFDPFAARSAHLFVHRLGSMAIAYFPNIYGNMSGINAGLRTDRLRTILRPLGQHTQSRLNNGHSSSIDQPYEPENKWIGKLKFDAGLPTIDVLHMDKTDDILYLQMPRNFDVLKQQNLRLAQEWQAQLDGIFTHYLESGWIIADYLQKEDFNVYIFRRGVEKFKIVSSSTDYL